MYKIRLYLEVYCEQWQYCWGTEAVYTPLPKHLAGGGGVSGLAGVEHRQAPCYAHVIYTDMCHTHSYS